jgi:hypothetical protein
MLPHDAKALIDALNRIQPFVAPVLYEALANNNVMKVAVGVANGLLTCKIAQVEKNPEPAKP